MDANRIKILQDGDPVHELQAKYAESKLRISELETQLAESRERKRKIIDLLNQIACRCTSELQDRSGQHVARVPGSRQWRDALYSIRLQIESMQSSQASAEEREKGAK